MLPIDRVINKIKPKQEEGELLLALVVGEKKVKSGVWTFRQGKGEILSIGSSESWGGETAEELVVAADASIAAAVASLPEVAGRQPSKVVLGLPENWLDGSSVKEEKAKILKTVCRKLLLSPQGFVITPEGIAHFLKKEEGDLTSLILVNLEETEVIVSLIVRGKYLGSRPVGRSNSLALDLEEGLLRLEFNETLPPRILLIDGENLDEARQALISYPWVSPEKQKKLPFLQLPRVDLAGDDLQITALVYAGSLEIKPQTAALEEKEERIETVVEEEPQKTESVDEETPVSNFDEDFGFIQGQDIALFPHQEETAETEEYLEKKEPANATERMEKPVLSVDSPRRRFDFKIFWERNRKIFSVFSVLPVKLLFKGFLPLLAGVIIVVAGMALVYFKIVKAQVTVLVKPARVEKEIEFVVKTKTGMAEPGKLSVAGFEATAEVSGKKTAEVTGRKTVGDKATGEATIYNGSDKSKTFAPKTVVKGPDGLKFFLTQEVSVPAKAVDINASPPVEKWGEKKATLEAADIGTQHNIAAGSSLSFESQPASGSSILIRNTSTFSGGTSREISAVSKADKESLQKSLFAELKDKAEAEIKAKAAPEFILPDSFELKNKTDRFDREAGDEASQLSLEENCVFSSVYFREEDLKALAGGVFEPSIPEGFERNFVSEAREMSPGDKKKNIYKVKISRQYFPQIDKLKIARQLTAKPLHKMKSLAEGLNSAEGYEVTMTPKIFSRLKFFPLNSKNITIILKSI